MRALAALRALVAVAVLAGGGACTTTAASGKKPDGKTGADEEAAGEFHTLAPGETLWDLARRSGLSVEEIVEVNGLPSADDVAAGQVIFLPAGGAGARHVPAVGAPGEREEPVEEEEAAAAGGDAHAQLAWPVSGAGGVVLRDFKTGVYDGLLIAAPAGTQVSAAAAGVVAFAGDQKTAYGLIVIVTHEALGLTTIYGHLASSSVKAGDRVQRGDVVGVVGTSGGEETPRLHFEARRGRTAVDPAPLLLPAP